MRGQSRLLSLRQGRATLEVAPQLGGSIAAYRWSGGPRSIDWFRPSDFGARSPQLASDLGCFPLVPFSNRVRNGRFTFAGRHIQLPVEPAIDPHFEHGHGWRRPWSIVERDDARLVMSYEHAADSWPWSYRAVQDVRLLDEALSITLAVTNRSDSKMPVGLGLHPYFLRTPRTRLSAAVADMWATDDQVLPTRRVKPPRNADPSLGIELSAVELDNVFTGWTGRAEITWPEWDARLQIAADPPLAFLVVYSPPTEDLFCVEPVSNITDALNMAPEREDTGLIVLEPGATASACVKFIPEISSEPSKRSVP